MTFSILAVPTSLASRKSMVLAIFSTLTGRSALTGEETAIMFLNASCFHGGKAALWVQAITCSERAARKLANNSLFLIMLAILHSKADERIVDERIRPSVRRS